MAKSPMLADHDSAHTFVEKLRFPLYGLPKIDGIRAVVSDGKAVSRKFIDIPNRHIFAALSRPEFEGLDGELIAGGPQANVFNATSSAVMKRAGEPVFEYHVFDDFTDPSLPYNQRQVRLCEKMIDFAGEFDFIRYVEPTRLETWEGLVQYEDTVLGLGFEGVITRHPERPYKFGRSTKNEQGMLKLKRFTDGEAVVTGFVELMINKNPDIRDNLGRAKRSKAQDGLVPGGTLGTFECRDLVTGVEFEIGMFKGLTSADKRQIWENQSKYLGRMVKYQHLSHGAVDKPRHSKFLGWRDERDL